MKPMSLLFNGNKLGRDSVTSGLNYWLGQLNSEVEKRYEVLFAFAESTENKRLFSEMIDLVAINSYIFLLL